MPKSRSRVRGGDELIPDGAGFLAMNQEDVSVSA